MHLPGAPFGAEGVPAVGSKIEPGHSLTITVTFDPTAPGTFSDQIGLDTSGGDGAIGLSGSAGLPGALQISSEKNEYGEVLVGKSASKSFTITNTGGTNVTITKSKPPVGGAFTATTSLPEGTTIEPGEVVTETVTFTPTGAGAASGVWEINGEDTTGLHEVQFSGTGTVPAEEPPPTEEEPPTKEEKPAPKEETPPVTRMPQLVLIPPLLQQGPAIPVLPSQEREAPLLPEAELTNSTLIASASGTVSVKLSCPARESRCFGRVALRVLIASRAGSGSHETGRTTVLTLAAGQFSVAGGRVGTVKLHLSRMARALLARRHLIRARVTLVAHDPKGLTYTTVRPDVTIRAV